MRLADPARSKAILIGAAQYDDPKLADIAQAEANVADLADILVDPHLGGFRSDNVRVMVNPRHKDDAGLEIARWCRDAEDVLVVYYVGHGLVDDNSELLLATSDTFEAEKEHHSLRVEMLRRAIKQSQARIKVFIVDCCYSGRAFGQVMADEASAVLGQIETTGTFGLASAPRHLASLFVEGERHTVFSGELIKVLRDGLPDEGPALSVFTVYQQLRRRMRDREHPEPKIVHSDSVSEFALVRNRAYRSTSTSPPRPLPPPPPTRQAVRPQPHTIAEADALVNSFLQNGITGSALATAAMQSSWPLFARLRLVSELARVGERELAGLALRDLQVPDTARAVAAINRLLRDLGNDRAWANEAWDASDLVSGTGPVTDDQARELWGVAMAMLLAAAELPTHLRVQAVEELADLGHHAEAEWIARGMLRDRQADPALVTEVRTFLARPAGGTPGQPAAGWPAPPRSGQAPPPT